MPKIVPLVEGDGEVEAVPILLRRTLELLRRWDFDIARPRNAHGCGNLIKHDGLERFVRLCLREQGCSGILIIMDIDTNCARDVAHEFSQRIQAMGTPVPIVIVLARREYETWLVASIETIAGQDIGGRPGLVAGCDVPADPEEIANPKRWLSERMPGGRAYKETEDQVR